MMEVAPTCQVNVITQHTSVIQCVFIGQWNCFNLKLEHKRLSIVKIVSSCRFSTDAFPRNDPYSAVVSCASSLRIVLLRFFRAECQENRTYHGIFLGSSDVRETSFSAALILIIHLGGR